MRARLVLLLGVVLAAGCTPNEEAPPTWHSEMRAVVETKCAACHTDGGIAPFQLSAYDDVTTRAALVRQAVEANVMPPWPPSRECTEYQFDRSLTAKQHSRFLEWIDDGMELGDEKDYVPPQQGAGGLSRIDLALDMPEAFTPSISPDEYRCFMLDWPYADARYVTGFRARPGTAAIVHHVIAFLIVPENVPSYETLEAEDPQPGWQCFGGPGGGGRPYFLGGWAPGTSGGDTPEGTGLLVEPGSKVVLQLHYNTSTVAPSPDVSGVDFKVDTSVDRRAYLVPWLNPGWFTGDVPMTIPPGVADTVHTFSFDPSPYMQYFDPDLTPNQGFDIFGASIHMHTHGTRATFEIIGPETGDTDNDCMVDIPRWDFGWQGMYRFQKVKRFEPGDKIRIECHFDNSMGTVPLTWGEGTGDEMCLGFMYVAQ